jgi:prolyl oligopeptidase
MKRLFVLLSILLFWNFTSFSQETNDPYLWLENLESEESLEWVEAHNEKTLAVLQMHPAFDSIYQRNLEVYNSDKSIIDVRICGNYVYNLLQDETNERGVWRRSLLVLYAHGRPEWEVLLNLDNLAKSEGKNWAFGGAGFLSPECTRCMISLSDRGTDANETREFDVEKKTFVHEGFHVPLSKSFLTWKNMNTLYVATDFDKGNVTQSGYPHEIRIWKRGTPIEEARILFKGDTTDIYAYAMVIQTQQRTYELIVQQRGDGDRRIFSIEDGKLVRLEVPSGSTDICLVGDQMVLLLRSDWQISDKTFPQGALISINYDDFLNGDRTFDII